VRCRRHSIVMNDPTSSLVTATIATNVEYETDTKTIASRAPVTSETVTLSLYAAFHTDSDRVGCICHLHFGWSWCNECLCKLESPQSRRTDPLRPDSHSGLLVVQRPRPASHTHGHRQPYDLNSSIDVPDREKLHVCMKDRSTSAQTLLMMTSLME